MHGGDDHGLDQFLRRVAVRTYECRHCGASITFENRVAYGEDGREHKCLAARTASYRCNRCSEPITFKDRRPFSADGSPHRCIAKAAAASRGLPPNIDPETGEILGPTSPGLF